MYGTGRMDESKTRWRVARTGKLEMKTGKTTTKSIAAGNRGAFVAPFVKTQDKGKNEESMLHRCGHSQTKMTAEAIGTGGIRLNLTAIEVFEGGGFSEKEEKTK